MKQLGEDGMTDLPRRQFLTTAAATGAAAIAASNAQAADASSTINLALMGANGRGSQLAKRITGLPGARITYVCDPDERAIAKGIRACSGQKGTKPRGVKDFRTALDDPTVDALIVATPNHWHAPATIMACAAGKHVYVEKPCSHTADEGERMTAAARSAQRVVQVGMQRRSGPLFRDAIARIHDGAVGEVLLAKSWYHSLRPSIGQGKESAVPGWLDFDLWQGPVTERSFRDNMLHYNWHFLWHWGNGELGNNGVHVLDICRWAMKVDYPTKVSMSASKLRYPDDDQQTPDTVYAHYDCDGRSMSWEGISWSRKNPAKSQQLGIEFRGIKGTMVLNDRGFTIYDPKQQVVESGEGGRGDNEHLLDFFAAVRNGSKTAADVEEGHKSALLCHLGNIAHRVGRSLDIDPKTGHIIGDNEAQNLWSREYRPGWLPS